MKSEDVVYFMAVGIFVVAGTAVFFAGSMDSPYPLLGIATAWFGIGLTQIALFLKCK